MLSNINSKEVRANIKKPTGNAKNIHHIGMLISISMTWPKLKYIIVASRPALKKIQADMKAIIFTIRNNISLSILHFYIFSAAII